MGQKGHDQFVFLNEFQVIVPEGYDHATRLDTFCKMHKSEFRFCQRNLTDKNYSAGASKPLEAGQRFSVKAFQIRGWVTTEDIFAFLRTAGASLLGPYGITLVFEQAREKLPTERRCTSFDKRDALGPGLRVLPFIYAAPDVYYVLDFDSFGPDHWGPNYVVLCFCEI